MLGSEIYEVLPNRDGLMLATWGFISSGHVVSPAFRAIEMQAKDSKRFPARVWVWVATDALHLGEAGDSFRPMASALLAQHTADYLGLYLPTARTVRAAYQAASVAVAPKTQPADSATRTAGGFSPHMADKEAMLRHSHDVDRGMGYTPWKAAVVSERVYGTGKAWVNDRDLGLHQGRGCNHGWYTRSAPYRDIEGVRLWQDRGLQHNAGTSLEHDPGHFDYSQTLSEFVYPWVLVELTDASLAEEYVRGSQANLHCAKDDYLESNLLEGRGIRSAWLDWATVLGDSRLAWAVNDDGPLPSARPYVEHLGDSQADIATHRFPLPLPSTLDSSFMVGGLGLGEQKSTADETA